MSKPVQGYEFVVEGKFVFPFDMLRYDRCWPAAEGQIAMLAPHRPGITPRRVTLRGLNEPTDGRWNSFGWKIISYDRIAINTK